MSKMSIVKITVPLTQQQQQQQAVYFVSIPNNEQQEYSCQLVHVLVPPST